ncbi:hypothetical protein [Comamonas sp. JC664]|uniref:hypothetical protein n=1 Tax=Comamonas sp. JC664 TaxID=2801917 RepID=UPI00174C684A|nr:hypothetical protein [Comamonas sp. JC664]MBL0699181.1 hypothetical protein [Comamonas sp. JC664]GHH01885.1 hypothetical protein GCM10012319_69920 [Comamonas sp. KCTC 72670]
MPPGSRRPSLLLTTLSLLLLSATGCFDVQQDLWIEPGGSARLVVDLAMPRSLTALAKLDGSAGTQEALLTQARAVEKALREDPEVTQVMLRNYEREGQVHLVYDVTVNDVTRLPDLYRRAAAKHGTGQQSAQDAWDFHIERQGGNVVYTQRFNPEKALAVPPGMGDEPTELAARELAKGMAKALLVNNRLTLRIHGPGIGETNGTLNEKKDTAEWKLNLAELMDAPPAGREFRAVVLTGEPLWLWPVVLGVPLAVLLLTLAAARKRRGVAAR